MGLLIGLLFGMGLVLVLESRRMRPSVAVAQRRGFSARTVETLERAGVQGVRPVQLVAVSAGLGLVVCVLVLMASQTVPLALAFGLFGSLAPRAYLVRRGVRRAAELREVWPDLVDNLASGVRAGLSLPEALAALGPRAPGQLGEAFNRFAESHRLTGAFNPCLDALAEELADPIGDRVVESLRLAREVGGTDLGRLLRTLSQFLREDARARAELETRQGWTVNAARLALSAPWVVLLLMATQSSTVTAYNSAAGAMVLAVGGAVSYAAYVLMKRIARLPHERRVLR